MSSESTASVLFKTRTKKQQPIRKREASSPSSSSDSSESYGSKPQQQQTSLVNRRKQIRAKNLTHSTDKKKLKVLNALATPSSSSNEDDVELPTGKDAPVFARFTSTDTAERSGPVDMGATYRNEIDTEHHKDAQAQFERIQNMLKKEREVSEKNEIEPSTSSTKIYRGLALYGAKEKEDTIKGSASSGLNRPGPIRATQFMRASVRWDYAPDICKDYKETGFCTFGDSCKFMHDRSDYKHGWEIERDWKTGKMKEAKEDEYVISEEGEDTNDKLPFKCFICRESFKNPVVTKCRHYFCEHCALQYFRKSKRCAVCNEKTDGIFNIARELITKIGNKGEAQQLSRKTVESKGESEHFEEEAVDESEPKILPKDEEYQENEDDRSSSDSQSEGDVENQEDPDDYIETMLGSERSGENEAPIH